MSQPFASKLYNSNNKFNSQMRKYSSSSQETTAFERKYIPELESKPRQLLDNRKQLYDGIDFKPTLSIGISSHVFELSEQQQVCYTSGNQYCIASSIDAQNMTIEYLPCNSINGETRTIQIVKNKKVNIVASLQVLETSSNQINKINFFSRRDQAHRDIVITAKGKTLGFVILSDGKVGFLLFDQSTERVNKFIVYFVNVERENVITKLDKPHKAIKIISSTMGDYNMILCSTVIYEVEVGLTQDAELVEFQVKEYLDDDEVYIEGGFVKSSFNLVLITSKYKVLLFDHHKLLSKLQLLPISIDRPIITDVQAGISEIVIQLDNTRLCVYNLRSRQFQFGGFISLLDNFEGDYQILDFKIMRRQIYIMIKHKIIQIWRVSIRSKGQQNLQLLAPNVSILDYDNPPVLEILTYPLALKQMLTVHSDGILRVWDLDKGIKGSKPFFEKVNCMTVHPIGNELFAGFKENGRVYTLAGFELELKCSLKIRGLTACKYTIDGQYLLLQQSNTIYQYNAYSFETVRSLFINLNNVSKIDLIDGVFYLQNDNYLGLYTLEGAKIIQKRTNCYHSTSECLAFAEGNRIQICPRAGDIVENGDKIQLNLEQNQKVTVIRIVDLLGIILVATSKGNLLQYMYPLSKEKPDSCYKYKAAQSSIMDMIVHETHEALTVITEDSIITTLEFIQLLEGQKTTTIYTISKTQVTGSGNRKSIMNRQYMFKGFELESTLLEVEKTKQIMELEFYTENFVNEVEQKRVRIKLGLQEELDEEKKVGQSECKEVSDEVNNLRLTWGEKIVKLKEQIQANKNKFEKQKEQLTDNYEQKLLALIHKDKALKTLKQQESVRLKNIIEGLQQKQHEIGISLFEQRESQYSILYNKLIQISKQLKTDREKADMISQEVEGEYKQLINSITKQLDEQLQIEENKNRGFNVGISKLKQEISMFNLRGKELENVIDEMEKQIKQLEDIRLQYELKKEEMEAELGEKEAIINNKQQELKKIFTENKNKKNLKDIHEYLMMEYQKQLDPGEMKRNELLTKVKQMNGELIHETQWKVEIKKQVKEAETKIEELKALKQKLKYQNIDIDNKLISLGHSIRRTMNKQPSEWMTEFKQVWDGMKSLGLNDTQMIDSDDKPVVTNKMIAKVIVGKEEIHRKIIESQKSTLWQEKHKEGVYKKIQNENIQLVKEHNLLQIEKKHLHQHVELLKTSMRMIEEADGVSLKRKSASLGVLTHRTAIKATPFQQYTAEQDESKKRFATIQKPLSTTRLKPISNSTAWMKNVVQDIMKSKGEASNIIQRKISSFANPQKSKVRKIISLHSHESSDKGEKMSKIFNNIVIQGGRERVMSGKERIDSARKS